MFSRLMLLLFHLIQYCNSQDIFCCDGSVRLAGGSLSNEGRVEICQSGEWKTVCDNNWSENEARVVCSQLGFTTQVAVPLTHSTFGMGTGMIVEQVRCSGTERQVTDCTVRDVPDGECNHNEDAGVRCSCQNGDLRLQGSARLGRGRVEVCINNVWGTVCDNSWNLADANVVCNQLGFSRFRAWSYCCARYGQGSGPIHISNVGCVGNESSLTDCPYSTTHFCNHGEDAAVQCQTRILCHDGEVRLVNSSQHHEGRIEICFNETWGTICNWISSYSWNHSQADIVCKQLGYSQAERSTYSFGRGSLSVKIASVYCRGTESNLAECSYTTRQSSLSGCSNIVGVQCRIDTIMNGTLRLTNGHSQYEGRVEIYWNSEWKAICNDGWDELDAMVVCRQMRYISTSVQIHALSYDDHHFKSRRSPLLLTNVGCNGSENRLTNCCSSVFSNRFHCIGQNYAGVRCSQCIENSIQLIGELSQQVGTLVICLGGQWGKVCGSLDTQDAVVACRQLGFSIENPTLCHVDLWFYFYCSETPTQTLPYSIENVQCTSNETQFSQCNYTPRIRSYNCRQWSKIGCQTGRENIPGAPHALRISSATSSTLTLTWSPPLVSEIHGLTISQYTIKCSSGLGLQLQNSIIKTTDTRSVTFTNLHPYIFYNCCVAAVSNHGRGELACIDTITAPNGTPTRLQTTLISSTTILFSWNAPSSEFLRGYQIQIIDNTTGIQKDYTTKNTHLLLNNLLPSHQYTFRVAAYTNERGPFSQLIATTFAGQPSPTEEDTQNSHACTVQQNQGPLTATASMLGLVTFILLMVTTVAGIYVSYRLCKHDIKKDASVRPTQVPVYEMVDMPPQGDSHSKPENLPQEHRDINVEQLVFKQGQAKDFSHVPHEYLTPTFTKFDQSAGPGQAVATNEENTYQPLIPPRIRALGGDKSEYQSLTKKSSTLPAKFNVSPIAKGPAPPAIPPKPKAI